MLICIECGHLFERPTYWEERHGLNYGPFEEWSGCPRCGGGYTEAHKCDYCDEYIDGTYIKLKNGERICENCYNTYELGEED